MNKFSLYIKEGMRAKSKLYKIEPYINPCFNELSKNQYTPQLDLQFHFEICIDTKYDQFNDEEGASHIKLFLKKGFVGVSITLKDEKINTQKDLFDFLKVYFNDALKKIILRLKKGKIEILDEQLILDFNTKFDKYFKQIKNINFIDIE